MAVNCGNFVEGSRVVDKNFSRKYFSKGLNRRAFSSLQSEVKTSSSLDYLVVHIPCKLLFYVQVQITGFSFVNSIFNISLLSRVFQFSSHSTP